MREIWESSRASERLSLSEREGKEKQIKVAVFEKQNKQNT